VHHVGRAHYRAAVQLADALQTETHTEDRRPLLAELADGVVGQARVLGATRPGRDQNEVGCERPHLGKRDLVVAVDTRLGPQLPEVLHEVVDERVVIVDDEHARRHRLSVAYADRVPQSKSKRSRYTAPPQKKAPPSKPWVPVAMTSFFAMGLLVIVTNYLNLLPGANTENRYLLLGIVLICAGFFTATTYR